MNELIDGDSLDIEIRPVADIVRRAAALAAIAERGVLEVDTDRDAYERDTDRFELFSWARGQLAAAVTPEELHLLETPVGEMGDALARCDDALVEAASLAWALSVVTGDRLPVPQDGLAEERALAWAPAPWTNLDRLSRRIEARPEEAIAVERERWELWYWRAADADVSTGALADVIADLEASGLIAVTEGDFATDAAEPFGQLAAEEQEEIAWLAERRLLALNWVCGFGESWDTVPLYPD